MGRSLRILYAAGPGHVIGTYQHWKEGRDDPSQVSMTYAGQFYDVCRDLDARGLVLASCPEPGQVHDGRFTIVHRPIPFESGPGALYHVGQIWAAGSLICSALAFRADVAVIVTGSSHWFPLAVLPLFGVKVVPSLHCVFWARNHPPSGVRRLIQRLDALFFARAASAFLSASRDIARQLAEVTAGRHGPVVEFLPTYRLGTFANSGPPLPPRRPFRVLYAGRIEGDKGVFDLLEIARGFANSGRKDIEFDLCGNGSALPELRRRVTEAGLDACFRCHGHCSRATMRDMFARSQTVIVPTTTDFVEGFNQVVAEGVLSGRPVITSDVCPALDYVREAVVEVAANDVRGYAEAVLKLCDDESFYDARCRGCAAVQPQFYDLRRSWAAALKEVVAGIWGLRRPPCGRPGDRAGDGVGAGRGEVCPPD
jgi:glycosyltransferase involved in cell wall biosynthesis